MPGDLRSVSSAEMAIGHVELLLLEFELENEVASAGAALTSFEKLEKVCVKLGDQSIVFVNVRLVFCLEAFETNLLNVVLLDFLEAEDVIPG